MAKKLTKATKISLALFGTLAIAGTLGTGAYFWVQNQNKNQKITIETAPDQSIDANEQTIIPYEYPEYVDNIKTPNNFLTKRIHFDLSSLINKNEIIKQLIDYGNYFNKYDVKELTFNENKIKSNLINIFEKCLIKTSTCDLKLEEMEVYYQLLNNDNIDNFRYNQLNIYIKWKGQGKNHIITKEYYDLISFSL